MKIAFRLEEINVRGTTVALYDYAKYNEELLQNQSIIVLEKEKFEKSENIALNRLLKRFNIFLYSTLEELETVLYREQCDLLYCIKYGKNDGIYSKRVKTVIHCVFDMSEPHGDVYAGVSKSLAKKYSKNLYVPHMIGLRPDNSKNLRKELGIPETAIVFGRYGGMDTFNLQFAWKVISDILRKRKDIYFLFINTPKNIHHENVLHLKKIVSDKDKNLFINTCDAHLECGTLGHSFGLAIGEFSVNNKPIIAYRDNRLWNTAHIDILKNKGKYFSNYQELYSLLYSFKKEPEIDWNCYKEYTPEKVMEIFRTVFLK